MTGPEERLSDEQIAAEIQRRELQVEYLRELSAALGYSASEPWTEETFRAIERASPRLRRRAALRTLRLATDGGEEA